MARAAWFVGLFVGCGAGCGESGASVVSESEPTDDVGDSESRDAGSPQKKSDSGAPTKWNAAFVSDSRALALRIAGNKKRESAVAGEITGSGECAGIAIESHGATDLFVARFDSKGKAKSCVAIGGAGEESPVALALSDDGDVYVAFWFQGAIDLGFGEWASEEDLSSAVVRLRSDGSALWGKFFRGALVNDIALAGESIVAVGSFTGEVDFEKRKVTSQGGDDAFVLQLRTTDGAISWANAFGAAGKDSATSVAIDSLGDAIVGGKFEKTISIATGETLTSSGGFDGFIVPIDGTGAIHDVVSFGGADGQSIESLALDADDNRIFSGGVSKSIQFDSKNSASIATCESCTYLAKVSPTGESLFGTVVGTGVKYGNVRVGSTGSIAMGGAFAGSFAVGDTTVTHGSASSLDLDGFVAVWAADGTPQFVSQLESTGSVAGVLWDSDVLRVVGGFTNAASLCGTSLAGNGKLNGFVATCDPR